MPSGTPDAMSQVKKGFKSLLNRKSRDEKEAVGDSQLSVASMPVEAPAGESSKMPQLTTSIPGSSLGPEAHNVGTDTSERESDSIKPQAFSADGKATYAEGMRATSGPIGSSLEEVEEFERMVERRSSVMTDEASAASKAVQNTEEASSPKARLSGETAQETAESSSAADVESRPAAVAGEGKSETDQAGDAPSEAKETSEDPTAPVSEKTSDIKADQDDAKD